MKVDQHLITALSFGVIILQLLSLVVLANVGDTEKCTVPFSSSWTRPFFIAVVADPQIGWDKDEYDSERLFREAATHLKRLEPDFVLVAGDLIQNAGSSSQYRTSKSILDSLDIPYYCVSGNHDVRSSPRMNLLNEFLDWWGSPYYWYTIPYYNTLFVMLESDVLKVRDDGDADDDVRQLAWEELAWLEATLGESTSYTHIIPIAHHPLAIKKIDEDDRRENTPRSVREDLLGIYRQHSDRVSLVLAGHYHKSAHVEDNESGIHYVTYPSTGVILGSSPRDPSGFALLEIDGKALKATYYGYDDMPKSRPESDNPGFTVTFPNGEDLSPGTSVCVAWSSTSMTNKVHLEYSLDNGGTWELIAESIPNQGVYLWRVPSLEELPFSLNSVLIKVSSTNDASIYGISETTNSIVSMEEVMEVLSAYYDEENGRETVVPTSESSDLSVSQTSSPSLEVTTSVSDALTQF